MVDLLSNNLTFMFCRWVLHSLLDECKELQWPYSVTTSLGDGIWYYVFISLSCCIWQLKAWGFDVERQTGNLLVWKIYQVKLWLPVWMWNINSLCLGFLAVGLVMKRGFCPSAQLHCICFKNLVLSISVACNFSISFQLVTILFYWFYLLLYLVDAVSVFPCLIILI